MSGATRFDADTAVTRLGDDLFEARMDRGWWVVNGPNGGYVAAVLLRALAERMGEPERAPRSLTIHYTRPPAEGPVRIEARVERRGRSLTTLSARMLQEERLLALALSAFSKAREGLAFSGAAMPELPPPERCAPLEGRIPIHARYEHRWAVGALPFTAAGRNVPAQCGGWIRLAEPRLLDAPLVAAYTDAFPPAVFSRGGVELLAGGIPTVDLSIHFRAPLPPPGARADDFALALFRSRHAREGFVEEDGEIWSRDGVLLAQSRQLALVL
jgi:acyl-CoA thioesterase